MSARLFRQFILRRLAQERLRTATTVVGVALGIAVVIAIQLSTASSVQGFETALESVAGRTSIEVRGAGGFVPEERLRDLGWLREFGVASPVVEGDVAVLLDGERTEAMRLLGVDILRDQPFRDYQLLDVGTQANVATTQQFLTLLTDERSAVLTEKFARRHGVRVGDGLRLMTGDRVLPFVVRGLLKDQGPARVLDGNFVLMDIAAAQLALDKIGRVDRLDVRLDRQDDVAPALEAVGRRLPPGLTTERPARRGEQVERMLAAFHLNLTALSWVALIVGLFLVYNTVTISVIARRQDIGTLRALGVSARSVLWLFLGEAIVLAVAGVALGLVLGRVLADGAVALTANTVSTLYVKTAAVPPALGWWHVALAIGIGIPLSLLAAAVPALEASRVPPTAAMRGADQLETRYRLGSRFLLWPGVALVAAVLLSRLGPVRGMPLFGYAASFATIAGASLLVPAVLFGVARVTRPWLRRLLGVEGLLAHASLASAIPRLSISVAALSVSLSMMVAIAVMIGSFRETVNYWIGQTLQADLFVSPGVRPTPSSIQTVSSDVIALVQSHPDVEATDDFRNVESSYRGQLIVLGSGNYRVVLRHGSLVFKAPANARDALLAAIGTDNVAVSEPFANRFHHAVGDTITLDTHRGPRPFRIAVVYYDYSNDRGTVVLDRPTFQRHFGNVPATGLTAYVREGVDPEAVRTSILGQLGDSRRIFLYTNRLLRAEVLRIFDSTFAITYALEVIAIVVAMLGVAGTLLTLVLERRRELSLLRLVGASRRQVLRMVVVEAGLIGAVSQIIGLAVGFLLSLILIYVINVQSFGWTIQFHLPAAFLMQATLAVIIGTALSGLYPARRAAAFATVREE